jgi:hypothetical protein
MGRTARVAIDQGGHDGRRICAALYPGLLTALERLQDGKQMLGYKVEWDIVVEGTSPVGCANVEVHDTALLAAERGRFPRGRELTTDVGGCRIENTIDQECRIG